MSYKVWSLILFLFLIACNRKNQFPPFQFEKTDKEQVIIFEKISFDDTDSVQFLEVNEEFQNDIVQLEKHCTQYLERDELFNLDSFEKQWEIFRTKHKIEDLNFQSLKKWFEITGTLLQITGEANYAEEMQNIAENGFNHFESDSTEIEQLLESYIYTKNIDHIHLNLFIPSEINYEHTLHGNVKISQELHYPEPGKMTVNFSMENRQYIELFIRIPSWAEGTTVTVKKVKYFAPPGGYCLIAKKWREGDIVEIHFPENKQTAGL